MTIPIENNTAATTTTAVLEESLPQDEPLGGPTLPSEGSSTQLPNGNQQNKDDTQGRDIENNTSDEARTEIDDDDDDVTVIVLDEETAANSATMRNRSQEALAWIDQAESPEMEERRRNVLMRELRRVQRASFFHFCLLCTIPTVLLLVVIATVVGQEEDCESNTTICELEPRTFINAFTTRCVCDAISYSTDGN